MPAGQLPFRSARPDRVLVVLLLLGLLLQAQAGVLRQLLGAAHWHRPAAVHLQRVDGDGGWLVRQASRLQAWRQAVQARSPLIGGHRLGAQDAHDERLPHTHTADPAAASTGPQPAAAGAHHHDGVARHHHAPQQAGLVALEPAGDGDPLADAHAGSLLQPLALGAGLRIAAPPPHGAAWPAGLAPAWQDARQRLPERPPQA